MQEFEKLKSSFFPKLKIPPFTSKTEKIFSDIDTATF
nr:MAG TPA: hypothetical protein [Caudoviricetes sp.]